MRDWAGCPAGSPFEVGPARRISSAAIPENTPVCQDSWPAPYRAVRADTRNLISAR